MDPSSEDYHQVGSIQIGAQDAEEEEYERDEAQARNEVNFFFTIHRPIDMYNAPTQ